MTLVELVEKKDDIEKILAKYYIEQIQQKGCRVFGPIIGQEFPTRAQAHLLIQPGNGTTSDAWEKLQREIKNLFSGQYIQFFTPGILDKMTIYSGLSNEIVERVKREAIPMCEWQKKVYSQNQEINSPMMSRSS